MLSLKFPIPQFRLEPKSFSGQATCRLFLGWDTRWCPDMKPLGKLLKPLRSQDFPLEIMCLYLVRIVTRMPLGCLEDPRVML